MSVTSIEYIVARRVSTLTVLCKVESLSDHVCGQDLEEHIGHGLALEHVAPDELRQHVELVCVDVGHALDHATGHHVDRGDDKSQEDAVDGEARMEDLGHGDRHAQHHEDDGRPPPHGHLLVRPHEPRVDVELRGAPEGLHELVPVKEVDVGEDACDGGERQAVDKGERGRKVRRAVGLVFGLVKVF